MIGQAVELRCRRRPAPRRRRERGDLLARDQLGGGLGALGEHDRLVLTRGEQRLHLLLEAASADPPPRWPPPTTAAAGTSAATRAGAARNSRSRARQARQVLGGGAARRAPRRRPRRRRAPRAAAPSARTRRRPRCRPSEPERLPPLGQAAVDLGVGEPGHLADLAVRQPLRPQHQAADLLRLESAQGLRALPQPLVALGLLVGGGRGGAALDRLAVARDRGEAFALTAQRERLVLDDRLEPRDELLLARGGRLREQDLDRRAGRRPPRRRRWPCSGGRARGSARRGATAASRRSSISPRVGRLRRSSITQSGEESFTGLAPSAESQVVQFATRFAGDGRARTRWWSKVAYTATEAPPPLGEARGPGRLASRRCAPPPDRCRSRARGRPRRPRRAPRRRTCPRSAARPGPRCATTASTRAAARSGPATTRATGPGPSSPARASSARPSWAARDRLRRLGRHLVLRARARAAAWRFKTGGIIDSAAVLGRGGT